MVFVGVSGVCCCGGVGAHTPCGCRVLASGRISFECCLLLDGKYCLVVVAFVRLWWVGFWDAMASASLVDVVTVVVVVVAVVAAAVDSKVVGVDVFVVAVVGIGPGLLASPTLTPLSP